MTNIIECKQCDKPLFSCHHRVSPRKAVRNAQERAVKYYRTAPIKSNAYMNTLAKKNTA